MRFSTERGAPRRVDGNNSQLSECRPLCLEAYFVTFSQRKFALTKVTNFLKKKTKKEFLTDSQLKKDKYILDGLSKLLVSSKKFTEKAYFRLRNTK